MAAPDDLAPLVPTLVADRFPDLGRELLGVLHSLHGADWDKPTVCAAWSVRDVAAHLLDTAWRRLSVERDGHRLPPPSEPITGTADLVRFLNELNATWVAAARRLSPRLLVELMADAERALAAHLAKLDPWGPAAFPVDWAGERESAAWFDVARELTERWLHQQQIRLAVGATPLTDPFFSQPVFDAFVRALPHRYRAVDAPAGASLAIEIRGETTYAYTLLREETWTLWKGRPPVPTAALALDEEPAWLLFTKGRKGDDVRAASRVDGDRALTEPFFGTVAVMA